MAIYPKADWQPLPENSTQPRITPSQFIVHTAVDAPGPTNIYNYFDNRGVGVESHFWVNNRGEVIQGMNTEVRADANYKANAWAISVETEDDGDPEANPWNERQIDALIDLGRWCARTHVIPTVLCPAWDKPGFGWHSMWSFADPHRQIGPKDSPWTPSRGKTCPGKVRIWQFRTKVMPEIAADNVPPTSAQFDEATIQEIARRLVDGP